MDVGPGMFGKGGLEVSRRSPVEIGPTTYTHPSIDPFTEPFEWTVTGTFTGHITTGFEWITNGSFTSKITEEFESGSGW